MKRMKLLLLIFSVAVAIAGNAQTVHIPNGDFEKWHMADTVEVLDSGWVISEEMGYECSPATAVKTTDTASGKYALFLQSSTCGNTGGIDFGFAHLDFAVNGRPDSLYFKYKLDYNGPSYALVELSMDVRNPTSGEYEMVGKVYHRLMGKQNTYTTVAVPIGYVRNDMPVKAWLQIWADDVMFPGQNNKLWIDDISFQRDEEPVSDTTTHVGGIVSGQHGLNIYPNPAVNTITINFYSETPGYSTLAVCDMSGRQIISRDRNSVVQGENRAILDISSLAKGVYMISVEVGGVSKAFSRLVKE